MARKSRIDEAQDTSRRTRRSRDEEDEEYESSGEQDRSDAADTDDDGPGYNRDEIGSGWDAYKESKSGGGDYAEKVQLKDDGDWVLGIALEDAPFAVYWRHWVQQEGKYFSTTRKQNPLTSVGNKPQGRTAFNFLVLADMDGPLDEPELKVLDASPTLATKLEAVHNDEKKGPLTNNWLQITVNKTESKGKRGGRTDYNVQVIKERDLEEDFDVAAPDDDFFEEISEELFTKEEYPYLNPDEDIEDAAALLSSRASRENWEPPSRQRSGARAGRRSR